jgi:hypothetical protein
MSTSSVFRFFSRLVMIGGFAMAVWFIFFVERPGNDAETEKQAEIEKKGPGINGQGEMANATDSMDVKKMPEGEKILNPDAKSDSGQGKNGRELRTVQVTHLHLPDHAGSRELSGSLAEIRMSWPDHLTISTIDVSSRPQTLADWRVSSAPAVVFQTEGQRLYSLEEVWPKDRLAKKIEQLIHGLVRVDKNWLPEVKGLERR